VAVSATNDAPAAFPIPTALLMHGFWKESETQARMLQITQFSKNLALAGAALPLFAFFPSPATTWA
jgi:putative oxidoreductase